MFADDRLAGELLPPRLGLAIIHDQVAVAQAAGGTEVENLVVQLAVEDDAGVAERAEGYAHRQPAYLVVGNFVPHENREWIGARLAVVGEENHWIPVGEPCAGLGHVFVARQVNRRDAVLGRSSGKDFVPRHRPAGEVGDPAAGAKGRIVGRQDFGFDKGGRVVIGVACAEQCRV